jgi:hypothetical protein
MSIEPVSIEDNGLRFPAHNDDAEKIEEILEGHLRYHYTQRLFIESVDKQENGYYINLGVSYPRDVSDCRKKDNVIKMVNVGKIKTIYASREGDHYLVNLPSRSDLYSSFKERHKEIISRMDWSMAKAIYSKVYQLTPVRNQLNSVIEIVDFVRNEAPDSIQRLENAQTTENTREYLRVFEELDYVSLEEDTILHGPQMEAADERGSTEEEIIGDIVDRGYPLLREKLDLRMLNHFPKFANSYYISALRRNREDLHLTIEDISENLRTEYQDELDTWKIKRKMRSLDDVDVIELEGEEVVGEKDVYNSVQSDLAVV